MYVLSLPAIYALELTPVCNNRCPGCSNVYASHRAPAPTSAADWCRLLEPFVSEAVRIRLTGGEPTLHPGFHTILDYATSFDAWVTLFTNGRWQHPDELVAHLRERERLTGLLVSLHGPDALSHEAFSGVEGSFGETLRNIELAISRGVRVAISTVITARSWNTLDRVVALAREVGAEHVAVNRYIGPPIPGVAPTLDQTRHAIERVEALAREGIPVKYGIGVPQCFLENGSEGCLAGAAYVAIDPWARVHPCAHSPTMLGSLHEHALHELWHGEAMNRWRALTPDACLDCAAYPECHGGCRASQEVHPSGRDPLRGEPLEDYAPELPLYELPHDGHPVVKGRLREEAFGYVLLGHGQAVPLRAEARSVLADCVGEATFAELAAIHGQQGLDLLGELWAIGLLSLT